jgi:hypothetical protein
MPEPDHRDCGRFVAIVQGNEPGREEIYDAGEYSTAAKAVIRRMSLQAGVSRLARGLR